MEPEKEVGLGLQLQSIGAERAFSNNSVGSAAALAEVCTILNAILVNIVPSGRINSCVYAAVLSRSGNSLGVRSTTREAVVD